MSRRTAVAVAAAALILGGCASTVDGTPPPSFPTTVQSLAELIQSGTKSLHSAHLSMRITVGGQSIVAAGAEQADNGKATALNLLEHIPSFGTIQVVTVSGKTYVRLPKSHNTSDKPWVLVRPGSSNPVVSAIGQTLQNSGQLTQLDAMSAFVNSAKQLQFEGVGSIDDATVGHYHLTIDVDRLPDSFPQKQTLQAAGISQLPIDDWIDPDGHSRKLTESLAVAGQKVSVVVALSDFDTAVNITAPPASQVDTS